MGGSKGGKPPAFDPGKDLKKSTQVYLKYLPQMLEAESKYRGLYDPQRITEQQKLQEQFGPKQYVQQLSALQQLDPTGTALREQVGQSVSQNLGTQYDLPPALQQSVASQYLGRQVEGGNVLGNAAATGADIFAGNAANQYYQQNLMDAQRFLQGPTPEQQLLAVQPVAPDRASAYVNPGAPAQAAQNYYQNYLAQYNASGGQNSGATWGQAIGATAGGILGGIYGGPAGSQLGIAAGGGIGGSVGGYFSDHRLKHDIMYMGRSSSGLPIFEFSFNDHEGRYRGTIAQEILSMRPDAVMKGPDDYYRVDYGKIDIPFESIPEVKEVEHAGVVE